MAHTHNAVCYDARGNLALIVVPDDDAQLSDPAFNLAGTTQLRIPHDPAALAKLGVLANSPGDLTSHVIAVCAAMGVTVQVAQAAASVVSQTGTTTVTAAAV